MNVRCVACLTLFFAGVLPAGAGRAGAEDGAVLGTWQGTLDVGAAKLRLAFNFQANAEGKLAATLDSIDQGVKGIAVDEVSFADKKLTLAIESLGVRYEATLDDRNEIDGTFTQSGASFPLKLTKADKPVEMRRPQTPQPPFPYREVRAKFASQAAGVELAGTLTLPGASGGGPFPAVVLITGSGPQDRDESLLGHKPFLVLADYLTRRGIAVLRYDDRGTGQSTGDFSAATSEDFAGDALGAVAWLKARDDIDRRNIGLAGHSEGGLIAPLASVRSHDVAFLVLLAGPGVTGKEILATQSRDILKAMGASEAALARQLGQSQAIIDIAIEETDFAIAKQRIDKAIAAEIAALPEDQRQAAQNNAAALDAQIKQLMSPWFRFFLIHDPAPVLKKVTRPVLAINGEKDLQVAAARNLAVIEQSLRAGGNRHVTVRELAGLNHLFQKSETGAPSEYALIEETMNEAALQTIGDWIEVRVKAVDAETSRRAARSSSRTCRCRRAGFLRRLLAPRGK